MTIDKFPLVSHVTENCLGSIDQAAQRLKVSRATFVRNIFQNKSPTELVELYQDAQNYESLEQELHRLEKRFNQLKQKFEQAKQ